MLTEQISITEYRELWWKLDTKPKYGAEPIIVDGIRFDSKAEAARYSDLLLMVRAGEISDLVLQPSYVLQDAFRDRDGGRVAAIRYKADFSYLEVATQHQVVEEVKGARTAVFLLKAKLFRFKYPQLDFRVLEAGGRRAR